MALIEIITSYMRTDEPQLFVDVVNDEENATPDLLAMVMNFDEIELGTGLKCSGCASTNPDFHFLNCTRLLPVEA